MRLWIVNKSIALKSMDQTPKIREITIFHTSDTFVTVEIQVLTKCKYAA